MIRLTISFFPFDKNVADFSSSMSFLRLIILGGAEFECLGTSMLWRGNVSSVNKMLYAGFRDGNRNETIGEYPVGKSHV